MLSTECFLLPEELCYDFRMSWDMLWRIWKECSEELFPLCTFFLKEEGTASWFPICLTFLVDLVIDFEDGFSPLAFTLFTRSLRLLEMGSFRFMKEVWGRDPIVGCLSCCEDLGLYFLGLGVPSPKSGDSILIRSLSSLKVRSISLISDSSSRKLMTYCFDIAYSFSYFCYVVGPVEVVLLILVFFRTPP